MAAQTPATQPLQIRIAEPAAGATISGAEVRVSLATGGAVARDGARDAAWDQGGLFHVFLDEVDVLQTPLLRFSLQPVAPGPHTLRVTLEDWPGGAATPAQVAFTVAPAPPPTGASWWLAGTVLALVVVLGVGLVLLWFFWVRPVQVAPVYDEDSDDPAPDSAADDGS